MQRKLRPTIFGDLYRSYRRRFWIKWRVIRVGIIRPIRIIWWPAQKPKMIKWYLIFCAF